MSSGANATGVPAADFQALAVLLHHLARSSRYGVQLRHSGQVDQRGAREAKRAGSLSPITTEECLLNDVPGATISAPLRDLATQRHHRRRHPWSCGRSRAVRGTRNSGDGFGRRPSHANYHALRENCALLKQAGLRVIELPMPRPLVFPAFVCLRAT